jgi:hypothetical protein
VDAQEGGFHFARNFGTNFGLMGLHALKRRFAFVTFVLVLWVFVPACNEGSSAEPATYEVAPDEITSWYRLLYYHVSKDRLSPPQAGRVYAHLAICMYEAAASTTNDLVPLRGQLNGWDGAVAPVPTGLDPWATIHYTAFYVMQYSLERYLTGSELSIEEQLNARLDVCRARGATEAALRQSQLYASALAQDLIEWASSDGFDATRLRTEVFRPNSRAANPGGWELTEDYQVAMEPFWDQLRPLVLNRPEDCGIDYEASEGPVESTMPVFDTLPGSAFDDMARAVWEKDHTLQEEERQIALYWADDPGETATPAGHWMNMLCTFIDRGEVKGLEALRVAMLMSVSISDVFHSIWYTKFKVNLIRPKTYIQEFMGKPGWEPCVETPPFPEYPSGHSGVSAAAATILDSLIGARPFVDSTHVIIGLAPRSFDSFWDAAVEAAESRHYGGIHFRPAIEDGLLQGRCAAQTVLSQIETSPSR